MGENRLAGERYLLGPPLAHGLLQKLGHAPPRMNAHPRMGVGELRIFRSNDKIAIQRELKASGDSVSVDCGDDGFVAGPHQIRQIFSVPAGIEQIFPANGVQIEDRHRMTVRCR